MTADIDSIDPGYSFINRGSISAKPIDPDLSNRVPGHPGQLLDLLHLPGRGHGRGRLRPGGKITQAVTDSSGTVTNITYQQLGGILDTGTIAANSGTSIQTIGANGVTSATALDIGAFATVPRLDVKAESISGSTNTTGLISALVSGVGQGSAFGVILSQNANVPLIDVGKNATIVASVTTSTVSPDKGIATQTSPFSLVSEAILDDSNSLGTINNAAPSRPPTRS